MLLPDWWSWNMVTAHRAYETADGEWRTLCGLRGSLKPWGSSEQRHCLKCEHLQHRYIAHDEAR